MGRNNARKRLAESSQSGISSTTTEPTKSNQTSEGGKQETSVLNTNILVFPPASAFQRLTSGFISSLNLMATMLIAFLLRTFAPSATPREHGSSTVMGGTQSSTCSQSTSLMNTSGVVRDEL